MATPYLNELQHYIDLEARAQRVLAMGGSLVPEVYDEIDLTYNGDSTVATVTYKLSGAQIALLTLGYSGGNLTSVVRT